MTRSLYIKNSALWAAYGDALGFITELADAKGVFERTKLHKIVKTIPWRRRIGGKFGVFIDLPVGCYSDDTELRLSTSRAIRSNGEFDVEAFSKVEIPVWLVYALGAGRGSKAAASNLLKSGVTWMTNFYDYEGLSYVNGGGNGAAMRIQPHVWAAGVARKSEYILAQVVRNSICTHGHARGIVGATFHALCLSRALATNIAPRPDEWFEFVQALEIIPELIVSDNQLASFWLPTWERLSQISLKEAFGKVLIECKQDLKVIEQMLTTKNASYKEIVASLECFSSENKGSGTKTAILAGVLSFMYRGNPEAGIIDAANLLGSDTDTIATMAGAILGATTKDEPVGEIKDRAYIESEALRLYRISVGEVTPSYNYPDLLKWSLPSSHLDFVGVTNDKVSVAGLGVAKDVHEVAHQPGKYPNKWQWVDLPIGQSILVKSRYKLAQIKPEMLPRSMSQNYDTAEKDNANNQRILFDERIYPKRELQAKYSKPTETIERRTMPTPKAQTILIDIDEATKKVIDSGFDPTLIGRYVLEIASQRSGIENTIAFAAIIAKAKIARMNIKN
jgi:ADP-ribosylglycohydrolase